jgi:hypothetical protein
MSASFAASRIRRQQARDCWTAPFVGNVDDIRAGDQPQHFSEQVRQSTVPRRCEIDLSRIRLRIVDEFAHRLYGDIRGHDQHMGSAENRRVDSTANIHGSPFI